MSQSWSVTLRAIRVVQPIGEFLVASIPARTLVEISYADVRRLADEDREVEMYLGIQRKLDGKRLKDLRRYVHASDATFPTSVILAVDERCAEYDADTCSLTLRSLEVSESDESISIPQSKIAKILDGQHRIAAFLDDEKMWRGDCDDLQFDINVAFFIGSDISDQASIFATVNLAQTKVNKSLVYDLTELARSRSPHRTCHEVAVALDAEPRSPLYRRIKRLGVATPGRIKEPLTQASFVESLVPFISDDPFLDRETLIRGESLPTPTADVLKKRPFRGLFVEGRDKDITMILHRYFSAIHDRWPESWSDTTKVGNLLPKANAFKALMKFLLEVYPEVADGNLGRVPLQSEFASYFADINISDGDFTREKFPPGSSGQSVFLKLLRGKITLDDLATE